jgi:methionyl-tRNA formyltransferase
MRVVILGKGLMLANLVLGAKDAGADIVGVFRYEHTCENRFKLFLKDLFNPEPEVTLLKELKVNQIRLKSANSQAFKKLLISQNVDLVLVGTWKEKLKKDIYAVPTVGTVNVHPSLLPKYRGPNPYIQTILHGEKETGVTLHLVDDGYDTGAILSQEKVQIEETDTSKELREKSVRVARKLVREFITDLNDKIITPIKQSEKQATYFPNISGDEKMIDFTFQTSDEIMRTVRALHPFLPCYITNKDKFLVINPYYMQVLQEDIGDVKPGDVIFKYPERRSVTIVCADGKAIRFSNLKLYKSEVITEIYIDREVETIS